MVERAGAGQQRFGPLYEPGDIGTESSVWNVKITQKSNSNTGVLNPAHTVSSIKG